MKNWKFVLFIVVMISLFACGKRITPSSATVKDKVEYDAAAFNSFYVEAIKQKLMGNNGEALKYLELCIKMNPGSDASYYQMANIVFNNGDTKNGKRYALMAYSIDPGNIWYLMMISGVYYQERNLDSAIIFYEKAVNTFPEKETLQLTLGNLYSENRNFDKANAIFNSLDKKYGVNEKTTFSSIRSLMLAEKYDDALVKAQLLSNEYPDEILYHGLLAEIYSEKGESAKALDVYNKLIEKNPDDARSQLSLCDFMLNEKSYNDLFMLLNNVILNANILREDKISLMARLIEVPDIVLNYSNKMILSLMVLEANYRDDDIIPLLRPEFLIKENKLIESGTRLEEIVKEKPDNYYAWEKLLLNYLQLGDYTKLMIKGEECATRFNRSFLAKILYANGALEKEKYSIALEEIRKAEILAGDNKDYIMQVLTMRADVYYRMKDFAKAFEIFELAVNKDGSDLTVLNNYAYYLAEQNIKLKEAEEMARKVIEIEKNNTTFLDTYGWVLYKRGKLKEAAKVMENIISSGEKPDAEWFEHYGFILKKQKKCSKAVENWNIAVKIDSTKINLIKEIENCRK